MERILFCSNSDLGKLQKFIHRKWKENHILAINKELIDFQYKSKIGYNFVISKNDNDEITAILGFIPTSHFDSSLKGSRDIWLSIWKVDELNAIPGTGLSLLSWLENEIQPQSIGSIGINLEVKKIYNILGYTTGILNQYYILNPFIQKYRLAKSNIEQIVESKPDQSAVVNEIGINEMEHLRFQNNPLKSLRFIENRYLKHPIYNYLLLGIYKSNILKAVFIVRRIEANQSSCLRIVDIYGTYSEIGHIGNAFVSILRSYNSEYIDCFNHGISEKIFIKWGFKLRNSDIIIPNYFEPFVGENIDISFAFRSNKSDYIIFKGDSDQDRPNII